MADPLSRPGLPHLPALDGLRGLAVVAVLLFHGGVSWAVGGFLGVDAFFVLSGYLITTLLLLEHERTGAVSLGRFWARRARRLLPALLLLVVGVAAYAAFVAAPDALASIRLDALATLGYVANWRFVAQGSDYFAHAGPPSPLLHAWSLAIEEQFYVLFPLVVVAVARLTRRRHRSPAGAIAVGAAVLALASAVGMAVAYDPGGDTSRLYYGTDTRAQSVLLGVALAGFLATVTTRRSGTWNLPTSGGFQVPKRVGAAWAAVGWVALVAATALAGTLHGGSPELYRGGFLGFGVAVAIVIAAVVTRPAGVLARALGVGPLAVIGRVSYGLYLWHWPVFLTLNHERTGLDGPELLAVRLAATAAIATASYHLVELPVRRAPGRDARAAPRPARVGAATPAAAAVVATAAVLLVATVPPTDGTHIGAREAVAVDAQPPQQLVARRPPTPPDRPVRVLLVGDSVASTLAQGVGKVAAAHGAELLDRSQLGCGVIRGGPYRYFGDVADQPPHCDDWPRTWRAHIRADDPDVVLLVVGRWEVMDRVVAGRWTHVGARAFDRRLATELDRAITVLSARGAPVALATAPYYKRGERPDGGTWPEDEPARADRVNAIIRQVAARRADRAVVVDLAGKLAPRATLEYVIEGIRVRAGDGVHITMSGGRWLAPWLLPQLTALARPPAGAATAPATAPPRR